MPVVGKLSRPRWPSAITPTVIQTIAITSVGRDRAHAATNIAKGKQIVSGERVFILLSPPHNGSYRFRLEYFGSTNRSDFVSFASPDADHHPAEYSAPWALNGISKSDSHPRNADAYTESMKDRSTVVCVRNGKILLVARARLRWSLPGGTIRKSESALDAASRELEEETSLAGMELTYLFQFGGLSKRHHVFRADIPHDAFPEARNEILRCHWFNSRKISTLVTSIPTREIVDLYCTHENRAGRPPAVIGKLEGRVNRRPDRMPAPPTQLRSRLKAKP
jgi:8-oxo-dGTP diphosphatase